MMAEPRKIKFRGLTRDGVWEYGYYFMFEERAFIIPRTRAVFIQTTGGTMNLRDFIEVIPETIGQYAALKDKNGIEIWEGDLVKYNKSKRVAVIEWDNSSAMFAMNVLTPKGIRLYQMRNGYAEYAKNDRLYHHKVIGNIHQNPELL